MRKTTLIEQYGLFYLAAMVVMAACAAVLVRRGLPRRWNVVIAVSGILFFIFNIFFLNYPEGSDFDIFYRAGKAVLAGADPYTSVEMNYPPSAVPLCALMARLPRDAGLVVWTALNTIAAGFLVPLAVMTLRAQTPLGFERPPSDLLGLLSAAMMLSLPIYWGINLGQLALFETTALLCALCAQGLGLPILSGVGLALATVKPQTLVPFLLLYLRRSDVVTWLSLIVVSAFLFVLSGPVDTLPRRVQENLTNISALSGQGTPNDYSFDAPYDHTIIGFDRLLYCLGLRDRLMIRIAQLGIVGLIGLGLAYEIWRSGISRAAACSLVALYALVFVYHRFHDAAIFALPLVYSSGRALSSDGRRRLLYVAAALTLVPILLIHPKLVEVAVEAISRNHFVLRRLAEALILPYATWCALLAMCLLYRAETKKAAVSSMT